MEQAIEAVADPAAPERVFTVGIPVFNGRSLLRNCLQSVINSTFPRHRFEIVVADDGSSEPETLAILREFQLRLSTDPGFFRLLSSATNSGGAARPRNRILEAATGEYVFFIDSDDTIGNLALERIAEAVAQTAADWVAINQVPVNGRAAVCEIRQRHAEVSRARALTTLTVHKVFRRAEIERQQLRFDEGLPSGQDLSFAFSYILQAKRFLMLGGYDYYYLTQHTENPNEPVHLSRRDNTPGAQLDKNERILRSMLTAVRQSGLEESEQRRIMSDIALPRILLHQEYLKAVVNAGPDAGTRALRRLSDLLTDPLVARLDPADVKGLTREHLAVIRSLDWAELAQLVSPATTTPQSGSALAAWFLGRGRRFVDVASGRARHRRVVTELALLRRSVEDMREAQRRLEARVEGAFQRRDDARHG